MSDHAAKNFKAQQTPLLILPVHNKKIWAIGGGKGGVGKSFIISNLAISLARAGKKVVVIDLDLGSANLHTCLGSDIPKLTLTDFFAGRVDSLEKILNKSPVPNLQFISGANDSVSAADTTDEQHQRLMIELLKVPTEYLLIDLGAGTHKSTLDYFLLANHALVGLTPEPTSIENAYRFIKAAYYRWVKSAEDKLGLKSLVDHAMDQKNAFGIKTPRDLINRLINSHPEQGLKFQEEVQKFSVNLIMNQVRTKNDIDTGHAVRSVCKKYFGIEAKYVGYLDYDNAVWQSVRKRRPLILEYPYSVLVQEFAQIAKNLDEDERLPRTDVLRTP
jgi:flagellar biosynthesis protein FlhG